MSADTREDIPAERENPPIEAVPVRHPGRWVGAAIVAVAVAEPLSVGQGTGGGGITKPKSKAKSNRNSQLGLQGSPYWVEVIVKLTSAWASGRALQFTFEPALMVAEAVAEPPSVGQGTGGGGIRKSKAKSKSKSNVQLGLHESPVCVDVTFRLTATSAVGVALQLTS